MRIVFSDLDGTFLDDHKEVTAINKEALGALADHNVAFVPCSGRPASAIYPEIVAHPATQFVVSSNGAVVSRVDKPTLNDAPSNTSQNVPYSLTALHAIPLSKDIALAVYELTHDRDVTFDIFADGNCYLRRDMYDRLDEFSGGDPYIAQSLRRTRNAVDEDPDETIARVNVLERVAIYWKDPCDRDEIQAALSDMTGIEVTRSYPMNIEIMDAAANKGTALQWLCDYLDIDVAESVSFGDNINDIPMIEAAGIGVAVKNAEPEVRAAANQICGPFTSSGVGTWLLNALKA